MELTLENNITNNLEKEQNSFLKNAILKAVDSGLNIGIKALLPNYVEDKVIEIKDNIIKYGLKEGIQKSIENAIDTGKSVLGIVTGKFENTYQVNEAIRSGGIIDTTSDLLEIAIDKLEYNGKINPMVSHILTNGKEAILSNIENNIENKLKEQTQKTESLEYNIKQWTRNYNNQDFKGMEKAYKNIEKNMKELIPLANTINSARKIETIHNLIKNNGQNFNLSNYELELANKLYINK